MGHQTVKLATSQQAMTVCYSYIHHEFNVYTKEAQIMHLAWRNRIVYCQSKWFSPHVARIYKVYRTGIQLSTFKWRMYCWLNECVFAVWWVHNYLTDTCDNKMSIVNGESHLRCGKSNRAVSRQDTALLIQPDYMSANFVAAQLKRITSIFWTSKCISRTHKRNYWQELLFKGFLILFSARLQLIEALHAGCRSW